MDTTGNPSDSIVFSDTSYSNQHEETGLQPDTAYNPSEISRTSYHPPQNYSSEPEWLPPENEKFDRWSKLQLRRTHILLAVIAIVLVIALVSGIAGALAGKHKLKKASSTEAVSLPSAILSSTTHLLITTKSSPIPPISNPPSPTTSKPTSTPPSTTYVTTGTTGLAELPCPYDTNIPYQIPLSQGTNVSFTVRCNTDMQEGIIASNGYIIHDFARFVSYTLEECLEKCAITAMCAGASYGANLTNLMGELGKVGNCALKNATAQSPVSSWGWMITGVKVVDGG